MALTCANITYETWRTVQKVWTPVQTFWTGIQKAWTEIRVWTGVQISWRIVQKLWTPVQSYYEIALGTCRLTSPGNRRCGNQVEPVNFWHHRPLAHLGQLTITTSRVPATSLTVSWVLLGIVIVTGVDRLIADVFRRFRKPLIA